MRSSVHWSIPCARRSIYPSVHGKMASMFLFIDHWLLALILMPVILRMENRISFYKQSLLLLLQSEMTAGGHVEISACKVCLESKDHWPRPSLSPCFPLVLLLQCKLRPYDQMLIVRWSRQTMPPSGVPHRLRVKFSLILVHSSERKRALIHH